MSANTSPIFTLTPVIGIANISTANTARDGSGTLVTVVTGGSTGTRISRIIIKATVTTTAGTIRFFINNGSTSYLWREFVMTAVTVSATTNSYEQIIELLSERALVLPSGYSLKVSTEKAENYNIIAEGGDY